MLSARPGELAYNLYVDPARREIWGNGQGETRLPRGEFNFHAGQPQTAILQIYGRIDRQTLPAAGKYLDVIVVTVTF